MAAPTYRRARVFAAACLGMLLFGVVLTALGSILPEIMTRFGLDRSAAGALFSLMSLGILAGSLVFGPLVDRYGYRYLLIGCALLIAAGLQGIAWAPSLALLRAAVMAIGLGGGAINGGTNALVADISEHGRSAGLSLLGVFFGVGALGVPFVMGLWLGSVAYPIIVAAIGAAVLLAAAFLAAVRFPPPKQAQGFPLAEGARLLRDTRLLLLGGMLFFESGMEITLGGWTAAYAREELGLPADQAVFVLSLYWLAMTAARLALGVALRKAPGSTVLMASVALALAGSLTLLAARSLVPAAIGIALVGAGLAAVFPIVLGYVGDLFPALSGTAFSIALVMALTGGMVLPWLTGVLGDRHGLRASFAVVPAGLCGLALLFWMAAGRLAPRPAPAGA